MASAVGRQPLPPATRRDAGIAHAFVKIEEEALLKRGQFSTLYRSKWCDQDVAAKCVISDHAERCQDHFDRVVAETQILNSVNHQNILRFHGIGVSEELKLVYIVLELLSISLRERCGRTPYMTLSLEERGNIALAVAAGLKYLHCRSIVHRNITTSNVVLTGCGSKSCGVAKICGFGAARSLNMKAAPHEQEKFDCRNQEACYRPPGVGKQAASYDYKASDRYQYGLTIMAMCLRQEPSSALEQDRRSDLEKLAAFKSPFCSLVEQCLFLEPCERPHLSCIQIQLKHITQAAIAADDQLSEEGMTTWDGERTTPNEGEGEASSVKDRVKYRQQLMAMLQKLQQEEAMPGGIEQGTSVADTGGAAVGKVQPTITTTARLSAQLSTKLSHIVDLRGFAKGIEGILDNKDCEDLGHELAKKRKNCPNPDNFVSIMVNSMERHDRRPFNMTNVFGLLSFFLDEDDCTCQELVDMIQGPGKAGLVEGLVRNQRARPVSL